LSSNIESIQNDIDKIEPKDRISVLLKPSEFVIPKLQSTQLTIPEREFTDAELDAETKRLYAKKTPLTDEEREAEITRLKKKLFEDD